MFEQGMELKKKFGAENVYDFSIGNPDLDPPREFFDVILDFMKATQKGMHGYMPNAGFPDVRASVAGKVSKEQEAVVPASHVIMTCGAAGGMNVIFKTILDPGDEVIVPRPCFVEYGFYIQNHGGKMVLVDSAADFTLNIEAIASAINEKTRAVLITSPNNPTGRVYPEAQIQKLGEILNQRNGEKPIYLIADEPYREIVYDGVKVPSIFRHCIHSMIATSYSKTLSIPGERIGYVAVNPAMPDSEKLISGLVFSNRILGFVNAPALMQRAVAKLVNVSVPVEAYRKRRDLFYRGLTDAGYEVVRPEGAFYLFCKSPLPDDRAFVNHLLN
jgi:aspartate aminotransferase